MSRTGRCRACGRSTDALDKTCPRCGATVIATDPRLCPFCGKLKDPFLEKCETCEGSYVPPDMRGAPLVRDETGRSRGPGTCPNCAGSRPLDESRCPWCNSQAPAIAPRKREKF